MTDRAQSTVVWIVLFVAMLVAMIGVIGAFSSGFGVFGEPGPDASMVVTAGTQNHSETGQLLVRIEHDGRESVEPQNLQIELWEPNGDRIVAFTGRGGGSPSNLLVAVDGSMPPPPRIASGQQFQLVEPDNRNYDALDPGSRYRVVVRHSPSNGTLVDTTITMGS